MAKSDILWPFIKSWEGGFSNRKEDAGGPTNMGVTIATWRAQGYDKDGDGDIDVDDLREITEEDAKSIFERKYWDRWKADQIQDQSIANILVDWVWGSGVHGIKIPQRMLRVQVDGIVGPKTLAALNAQEPKSFFEALRRERENFFERICETRPANRANLKGWLRRLWSIRYGSLVLNKKPAETLTF